MEVSNFPYRQFALSRRPKPLLSSTSLEILYIITDECAEQGIRTIAALQVTNNVYNQRVTTILFRRQNINGHENSASSYRPFKFLHFFSSPTLSYVALQHV